jgi:multidrug efflux pump subunit AcrA (membrane-fusion protein)
MLRLYTTFLKVRSDEKRNIILYQEGKTLFMNYKKQLMVILTTLLMTGLISCKQQEESQPKEVVRPVKVQRIKTGAKTYEESAFSGVAAGISESVLSFRVPGVIKALSARVGQRVKANEIVARLDDRDYRLNMEAIKNQLTATEAQLDQLRKGGRSEDILSLEGRIRALQTTVKTANTEYQRVQNLYAADAASKSQLDQIRTQYEQSRAELESTRQELAKAKTGGREEEIRAARANIRSIRSNLAQTKAALEDTVMKIPFNGIISQKHTSNFQQVSAGMPIYSLVDISRIEIQISVPERMISSINAGRQVSMKFLNFPDRKITGVISKVGVTADRQTLTYPVFVEVVNPEREILPGMTANIFLHSSNANTGFPIIPIHSILEDKITNGHFVWIVDETKQIAKRREISLGRILNEAIEVLSGLKEGELVITGGMSRIRSGMKIRILQ